MSREHTSSGRGSSRSQLSNIAYIGAAITDNNLYNDRALYCFEYKDNNNIRDRYPSRATGLQCPRPMSPAARTETERGRQTTEGPEDKVPYSIAVDLNKLPKTNRGFVVGRDERFADLVIPPDMVQVSNQHFALTFNDNNEFIVQDLNSTLGTTVKYDGHSPGTRRKRQWIIGGTKFVEEFSKITIEIPHGIEFQIFVKRFDPNRRGFKDKVNKFLGRGPSTKLSVNGHGSRGEVVVTRVPTGVSSPDSKGTLILRRFIGSGGFAQANLFTNCSTGSQWVEKTPNRGVSFSLSQAEATLLQRIKHPNIIQFLRYAVVPQPTITLEYVPGGTLSSHLAERKYFTLAETIEIARQSTSAVNYIHKRKITHRDISSANIFIQERDILLTGNGRILIKLADFGLAKAGSDLRTFRGTPEYMPPEMYVVLRNRRDDVQYTDAVDIWSLGVVLAQITLNLPPLPRERGDYSANWCNDIVSYIRRPRKLGPKERFISFVRSEMLHIRPRERQSAEHCEAEASKLGTMDTGNEIWEPENLTDRQLRSAIPGERSDGSSSSDDDSAAYVPSANQPGQGHIHNDDIGNYLSPSINNERTCIPTVSEEMEGVVFEDEAEYENEEDRNMRQLSTTGVQGSFDRYMSDEAFQVPLRDGSKSNSQSSNHLSTGTTQAPAISHFISLESIHAMLQSDSDDVNYCDILLDLRWDLLEFCHQELSAGDKLHHVLTLTGTPTIAEATTCADFVSNRWGQDGIDVLDLIVDFLGQNRYYTKLSSNVTIEIHLFNSETGNFGLKGARAAIRGDLDPVTSMIQLLAWLTAVFRVATAGCLVASTALFRQTPPGKRKCQFELSPSLTQPAELLSGAPDPTRRSVCWHRLFHGTILAYGFPTSGRKDGVGIEIPFELMVNLASITTVVPRQTGSFLLIGHSVTLFPTAKTRDGIQWHAVSTADIEAIAVLPEVSESVKGMDVQEMASYRTFLGYYEKAHVLLGTKAHIETYGIADCGLDRTKGGVALCKEGTFSLGFSAKGIINGGVAGKWTLYKHHRVSLIDNRGYFDLLNNARNRPLLIYDTTSCTAWLVSELSLVLHTALTYLRQPSTQRLIRERCLAARFPRLPYALPCHDGGLASLSACQLSENHDLELWEAEDGTPKRFWNIIDDILKDLSNIRDAINLRRVTSTSSTWPRKQGLRGWDFQSLATKPDTIYERELPCPGNETSWWKLQEAENMLVIFGGGFGTLIDPSPGKTPFGTSGAPFFAKLLIASTLCVDILLKEKNGKFYLGPLVWNEPKENKKSCNNRCNTSSCLCIQELASTPRGVPHKDKLFEKWQALVFGEAKYYHAALATSHVQKREKRAAQ